MPVTSRLGDSRQGQSRNLRRAELGAFLRHRGSVDGPGPKA
jgi:hypothetical protein